MRLLHTSDWHLGRSFFGSPLLDAQAAVLEHLIDVVRTERVDAVLLAGDVYDRALPPADAVALLDETLTRLVDTGTTVIAIAGNHDSAARLAFGSALFQRAGVHLVTARTPTGPAAPGGQRGGSGPGGPTVVALADEHGPVDVYALPYRDAELSPAPAEPTPEPAPEHADEPARGAAGPGRAATPATELTRQLRAASAAAAAGAAHRGARSVVVAHGWLTGGEASSSERALSVGGLQHVSVAEADGFDYAALGHLHRPQALRPGVRYSGSPLPYSFDETTTQQSWLVDLGVSGVVAVRSIPTPVPRSVRTLRGRLADLLADPALEPARHAYVHAVLTDPQPLLEPMRTLQRRFPHAVRLTLAPDSAGGLVGAEPAPTSGAQRDDEVAAAFLQAVRGRAADAQEQRWLDAALTGAAARLADPDARS